MHKCVRALLTGAAMTCVFPAGAQTPQDIADLKAEVETLKAQLKAMEAKLDAVSAAGATAPAAVAAAAPAPTPSPAQAALADSSWKGGPQLSDGKGWSFKPRGRMHLDVGTVSPPDAIVTRNVGTNVRMRRIRLGAEGTMPGGFGYKVEADFANSSVGFGDAYLSYTPARDVTLRLGNYEPLNGFEQPTSSNYVTFTERAAFNDAFINTRRLGGSIAYAPKGSGFKAEVGMFASHSIDSSLDADGYILAGRTTYSPQAMGGQLHLGLNSQYRHFTSNNNGAPATGVGQTSSGQLLRLRARPNSQLTDLRFVDTGNFAARSMTTFGVEAAAIFKGPYFAVEGQFAQVDGYGAGDILTGLDSFGGSNSAVTTDGDPGFFGGYVEAGYFLTGEARGYKDGEWARTKVLNPVSKGGSGAFQVAARIDYLNLQSSRLQAGATNNFNTGASTLAPIDSRLARGGSQTSYIAAVNWLPVDYIRFMVNYAHLSVEGGPFAATVRPTSTDPVNERGYGVDVIAARMQIDF